MGATRRMMPNSSVEIIGRILQPTRHCLTTHGSGRHCKTPAGARGEGPSTMSSRLSACSRRAEGYWMGMKETGIKERTRVEHEEGEEPHPSGAQCLSNLVCARAAPQRGAMFIELGLCESRTPAGCNVPDQLLGE